MAPHLGNRARAVLRYAAIALATLGVFVVSLQLAFPYERVKAKIVDALSDKYDVTVGDIERSWVPGRFSLKALTLRTRQTKSDDPVTTFFIERLDIDLHFLAALHGTASVDLDAKIGAGHIAGNVAIGKSGTSIHVDGTALPAASLPMRELLGLPMSGKLEFAVALDLPNDTSKAGKHGPDWSLADGEIDFSCPTGCSLGDGKTKLKPKLKNARSQAFAAEGIEFGKVDIQSLFAEVSITPGPGEGKPGKLQLKRFDLKSLDGDLKVDFMMTLMPDINDSPVAGCLRYHGSPVLEKREEKTYAELQTLGASIGPDGLFHIKLTDKFRDIKRLPQTCGPETNTNMDTPGAVTPSAPRRPNLVLQPDGSKISPTVTVQPQPPPPPATPPPPPPVQTGSAGSATGGSATVVPTDHPAGPEGEGGSAGSAAAAETPPAPPGP